VVGGRILDTDSAPLTYADTGSMDLSDSASIEKGPYPNAADAGAKEAKEKRDETLAEGNKRNKDQKQKGDALLDRYPGEDDLQESRYRALGEQLKLVDQANEGGSLATVALVSFMSSPQEQPTMLRRTV
jgi:hypothetical protein